MRGILIICWCMLLLSCGEKVIKKPDDLIPRAKMTDILYELALMNAAKAINPNVLKDNDIDPMHFVYDKFGIDSAQFAGSDIYYASVPLEYEAIYQDLENKLEKQKSGMEEKLRQRNDSTRQELQDGTDPSPKAGVRQTAKDTLP